VIATQGTLAQIIPPSLVLIVMAISSGKSVGDMYEGAFIPGIVLAGMRCIFSSSPTSIPTPGARAAA
jgi:TRAP-type mannitol/chloroaromatic compound transport system permease large subunit